MNHHLNPDVSRRVSVLSFAYVGTLTALQDIFLVGKLSEQST